MYYVDICIVVRRESEFETKAEVPGVILSRHCILWSVMRLFVNMRQKHVIWSTFLGAASNRETGVCCGGRGLVVLL